MNDYVYVLLTNIRYIVSYSLTLFLFDYKWITVLGTLLSANDQSPDALGIGV